MKQKDEERKVTYCTLKRNSTRILGKKNLDASFFCQTLSSSGLSFLTIKALKNNMNLLRFIRWQFLQVVIEIKKWNPRKFKRNKKTYLAKTKQEILRIDANLETPD
ncbi:hypothetical protein RCL_jg22633.t1 [Rhizophagus clarus]|uniref:Uncharacterized protein n=1 Tax=Rhizophagus clarus TaxID=94130 RepID=A0A8H3ME61_9GLOM|nr:hypothetical protein RCL_jg22633.t1 [Rhizophagus clarus]